MADMRQILGNLYDSVEHAPVEIRDADSTLMGRGTVSTMASGEVFFQNPGIGKSLPSGHYLAKVVLPIGVQIVQPLVIDEGGGTDLNDVATGIVQAVKDRSQIKVADTAMAAGATVRGTVSSSDLHLQGRSRTGQGAGLEGMGAGAGAGAGMPEMHPAAAVHLRLFEGTFDKARPLDPHAPSGDAAGFPGVVLEGDRATVRNTGDVGLTMQLSQALQAPLNIVVPPRCTVTVLRPTHALQPGLEMTFGVPIVDELIALRTNGALSEAVGVAKTLHVDDVLAIAAAHHPMAAIAIAYIFLRIGIFRSRQPSSRSSRRTCRPRRTCW
jgi:hypothetical protein